MPKKIAAGLIILIVVLGMVFLTLDILDIDEYFTLPLPVDIFNTVFLFAFALLLVYLTVRRFFITGFTEVLVLGGAQLILGTGNLLRGWLPVAGLDIPITLRESLVLIASLAYIGAGIQVAVRKQSAGFTLEQKQKITLAFYLGVLIVISLVILFVFQGIIPSFIAHGAGAFTIQDITQETAALFFLISAFIFFFIYRRSGMELHYWYCLGLLLFALGVLFVSMGHVESRIAWLGRFSQYFGNGCFLITIYREKFYKIA